MAKSIYDIDKEIENCVDAETGEVNEEMLQGLLIERETKIEQLALWIKDLDNTIQGIMTEQAALGKRKESLIKTRDNVKGYITKALQGEKFSTNRVQISYRKSKCVVVPDVWEIPKEFWSYGKPTANKTMIKDAIDNGQDVPGAWIEENTSTVIR